MLAIDFNEFRLADRSPVASEFVETGAWIGVVIQALDELVGFDDASRSGLAARCTESIFKIPFIRIAIDGLAGRIRHTGLFI